MVLLGLTFQSERRYLDLLAEVFDEVDYVEVTPETLWRTDAVGDFQANGYHHELQALVARTGVDVVAHGVGLSPGTIDPADTPRLQRWLARIALDHEVFRFLWYTEHLGATMLAGRAITLPVGLPMTAAMAEVVGERLAGLQAVVPDVGLENTVVYFTLGDWLDEPAFFDRVLSAPRTHLLLDLHNVFTMAANLGVDPSDYLDRVDLDRVVEIHLSGGSQSDPAWLPSGRTLRLDSHDAAVPDPVWHLFERYAPRCPNLRGVTVERMEGTVEEPDVAVLRGELARAREAICGLA